MLVASLSFAQIRWRLSPIYLFYFVLYGSFLPYIARFLTTKGLSEQQAGIVVAAATGVNLFAPLLFSYLADKLGRRVVFIRYGCFGMGLFYSLSLVGEGFWFYLATFGLFGVFLSAVLPQMEAVSLATLGEHSRRYGQIRLWGSLGFVIAVSALGVLLDLFAVDIIIYVGTAAISLMSVATFFIPEHATQRRDRTLAEETTPKLINWSQVTALLVVIVFWQFGLAPYNTFLDLYLGEQGLSAASIGLLISFGSLCEIAVFLIIARLYRWFSERMLMIIGLLITVVRWVILYFLADSVWFVLLSQSMHAATFGILHAVTIHRMGHLFPQRLAGFAQGLYVAIGYGFGLMAGNLVAGYFWDGSGIIFLQAAVWTLLAALTTIFFIRDGQQTV